MHGRYKPSTYFRNFFHDFRHKLWIVGVFLEFLEQSFRNVIFVIVIETLQEVGVSKNDLRRCPVSPAKQRILTVLAETEQHGCKLVMLQDTVNIDIIGSISIYRIISYRPPQYQFFNTSSCLLACIHYFKLLDDLTCMLICK